MFRWNQKIEKKENIKRLKKYMLQGHVGVINIILLISKACGSGTVLATIVKPANTLRPWTAISSP